MTDSQVINFVNGCTVHPFLSQPYQPPADDRDDIDYPAYELYTDVLRSGIFPGETGKGRQLRLVVGEDRRVREVIEL